MQVEMFLDQLDAARRREQARYRTAIAGDFILPDDLAVAIRHRWFVVPVQAQALFPPRTAYLGVPDDDPGQIASWAATYGDSCNWAFVPRPGAGAILEITFPLARHSLAWLADHARWDWRRTLRYRAGNLWFVLISWPAAETRMRPSQLPGLRLHSNPDSGVLIPPSQTRESSRLEYVNPSFRPAKAPAGLSGPDPAAELDPDMSLIP